MSCFPSPLRLPMQTASDSVPTLSKFSLSCRGNLATLLHYLLLVAALAVFLAPALGKMRCFLLARSSASQKQQLRRSRSCRAIEFSNLQRVELPAASLTPSAERKPSSSVMTSWSAKSSNPKIGDGQQPRHHGGDKPPVGDLHAAAEPISCCCLSRIHEKVFCFVFCGRKTLTKRPFFFIKIKI